MPPRVDRSAIGATSRPDQASTRSPARFASNDRAQIAQPSLFIAGSKDAVITGLIGAKAVSEIERMLPNLKRKLIVDGGGHWIQQERADEVNTALIAFLTSRSSRRPRMAGAA